MDIPETEKLDVNVPSAFSDPTVPLIFLSLFLFFLFFFLSLFRTAFAQHSMEIHRYGGLLLSFSIGERKKERKKKKNNFANFPSRTRALGQPLCEIDVLPHLRAFSRSFALQSGRRIKGAAPRRLNVYGLKPSSRVNPPMEYTNSIPTWIIYDLRHFFFCLTQIQSNVLCKFENL